MIWAGELHLNQLSNKQSMCHTHLNFFRPTIFHHYFYQKGSKHKVAFLLLSIFIFIKIASAQPSPVIKILLVTAHPDDEAVCAATVYKITHDLKGIVDLALITNGEGGYNYSTLAEDIYGLELSTEEIGRAYLPAIRKQELIAGGNIIGIRNYFFLDQRDHRYTKDVREIFEGVWDTDFVIERLRYIIAHGNYDYLFTLLPTEETHGHHKGATILALRAVSQIEIPNKPVILGCTTADKDDQTTFVFKELDDYPITKINREAPIFTFDRTQKFGYQDRLNYKIIVNWLIAEHKSQGTMQLAMNQGDYEKFWFFSINDNNKIKSTTSLFRRLEVNHFKKSEYGL